MKNSKEIKEFKRLPLSGLVVQGKLLLPDNIASRRMQTLFGKLMPKHRKT